MASSVNLRKAAILVAALDRPNAEALLRQLPDDQAAQVRRAAQFLEDVNPAEQDQVIAEFFRIGPLPSTPLPSPANPRGHALGRNLEQQPAGIELDGNLAARFARPRVTAELTPRAAPSFEFLQHAPAATLARLLAHEHPQTIAVVTSHLSPAQAAGVLTALPADLQAEVLRRLTALDELDPESLHELEQSLESWLSEQMRHHAVRRAGLDAVAGILDAASPQARAALMGNLRERDTHLAEQFSAQRPLLPEKPAGAVSQPVQSVRPTPPPMISPRVTFAQLAQFDGPTLIQVLRHTEPELIVLALAGADEATLSRFTRHLTPREATALRRDLNHLGPTRLSDVAAAQEELTHVAQQLVDEGQIQIGRGRLSIAA